MEEAALRVLEGRDGRLGDAPAAPAAPHVERPHSAPVASGVLTPSLPFGSAHDAADAPPEPPVAVPPSILAVMNAMRLVEQ